MFDEKFTYNKSDILTGLSGTAVLTSILLFVTSL